MLMLLLLLVMVLATAGAAIIDRYAHAPACVVTFTPVFAAIFESTHKLTIMIIQVPFLSPLERSIKNPLELST